MKREGKRSLLIFLIVILSLLNLSYPKLSLRLQKALTGQASDSFLKVKSSPLGEYISDKKGWALYLFENDAPNKSKCIDSCEKTFIPFVAEDVTFPPDVDSRLESSKVGLTRRPNGKYQVTYNKIPLYKYKLDMSPDDRKGHRRKEFGGRWSLLRPDGTPLDSRIGSSIQNISNVKGVALFSTGISKILVTPDVYTIRLNLTESNPDAVETFANLRNDFQTLNLTLLAVPGAENLKLIPIEKKISTVSFINDNSSNLNITNYLVVSQSFEIVSEDLKLVYALISKLYELKNNLGNGKLKFFINFSISPDNLNNAISLTYGMAIKDAFENANILVDPLNLSVDGEYPIKSINVESMETIPINHFDMSLLSLATLDHNKNLNSMIVNLKAIVAYNIKKKTN